MDSITEKRCSKCGETKALEDYDNDRTTKDGKRAYCTACHRVSASLWRKENPEKKAENNRKWYLGSGKEKLRKVELKRKYGITLEQYGEMFENQNGVCAICKSDNDGNVLHVDHDHKTGKVRGLLCGFCNKAIGFMKDDAEILSSAARYLKG